MLLGALRIDKDDQIMQISDSLGTLPPKMVVPPPGPKSAEIAATLSKYESTAGSAMILGKVPVAWETAKGANIIDVDGNIYVDFTSGFFVANAGHTNPEVVEAIKKQADHLVHTQGAASPHILRAQLTKKLVDLNSPGKLTRVHIASTGAEAVEIAMKFAKAYTGAFEVLAFHGGFHGKTREHSLYERTPSRGSLPASCPRCYSCALRLLLSLSVWPRVSRLRNAMHLIHRKPSEFAGNRSRQASSHYR